MNTQPFTVRSARLAASTLALATLLAAAGCSAHKSQEPQSASAATAAAVSKVWKDGGVENKIVANVAAIATRMADPTRPLPRDTKSQIAAGVFPRDMLQNGAVKDAWGDPVSLQSGASGTGFQAILNFGGKIGEHGNTETAAQCAAVAMGVLEVVKVPASDYMTLAIGDQRVNSRADAIRACGSKGGGEITLTVGGQY